MLDHYFSEEIFPEIQAPLVQFPLSSCWVPGRRGRPQPHFNTQNQDEGLGVHWGI